MELFQDFFVKALLALVFACVITKLVSVVFLNAEAAADENIRFVGKQVKLDNNNKNKRLRIRGTESKRSVKFADDVVVKHVDYHYQSEAEEESKEFDIGIKRTGIVNYDQDHVCEKGSERNGVPIEPMEKVRVADQGEIFTSVDQVVDHDQGCDRISESTRILFESMEEVKFEDESENVTNFTRFDRVDDEELNEEGKVILQSDEVVQLCVDDREEVSKNIGLLNQEVLEGKGEDIMTDETFCVKDVNVTISGVDSSMAKETTKHLEDMMETEDASLGSGVVPESDAVEDILVRLGENPGGLSQGDEEEERKVINEGAFVIDDYDDEWEEIERTQLEKRFGKAVNYVECGVRGNDDQLANLGSDVQMQLYGLHKIAVEGPCHEPQPMALNFSARAKWNAWQKHGSMSPEVAMEEYIKLLTERVPSWIQHYSAEDGKQDYSEGRQREDRDSRNSFQDSLANITSERELESNCVNKREYSAAGTNSG